MASRGTKAVHGITPVEVHIRGGKALAESTVSIHIRLSYEGREYDCTSYTTFVSQLEKLDDGTWKLLTLTAIYDRDTLIPPAPDGNPVSLPVDTFVCRQSYRRLGWVLSLSGYAIIQDLPGKDDPASVTKLMNESFSWLRS